MNSRDFRLSDLVMEIEDLLEFAGNESATPPVPSMLQMWQLPQLADLKQEFVQFQDKIKFGDPFYIAKQQGKGRVLAYMGSAGASGPEGDYWSSLNRFGRGYFPPLMKDSMQRYLCSTGGEFFLPLMQPFEFELDPLFHEKDVRVWSVREVEKPAAEEDPIKVSDLNSRNIVGSETELTYKFTDGKDPGMYLFDFSLRPSDNISGKGAAPSDLRALAYNFDTTVESRLLRARSDELKAIGRVEKIETLDVKNKPVPISREKTIDLGTEKAELGLSKSPWMFLGMLLALILEQAWAVRLSFHVRNAAGPAVPQPLGRGTVMA